MKIGDEIRANKWAKNRCQAFAIYGTCLLGVLFSAAHPFYVSITEVAYFPEERLLGVTVRVFTDDLEQVVESWGAEALALGSPKEHVHADQWLASYLDRVVQWRLAGQRITLNWLGKEVEGDVTYMYLEARELSEPRDLVVQSTLFLDQIETQENVVHLRCGDNMASVRLNRSRTEGLLQCP